MLFASYLFRETNLLFAMQQLLCMLQRALNKTLQTPPCFCFHCGKVHLKVELNVGKQRAKSSVTYVVRDKKSV